MATIYVTAADVAASFIRRSRDLGTTSGRYAGTWLINVGAMSGFLHPHPKSMSLALGIYDNCRRPAFAAVCDTSRYIVTLGLGLTLHCDDITNSFSLYSTTAAGVRRIDWRCYYANHCQLY